MSLPFAHIVFISFLTAGPLAHSAASARELSLNECIEKFIAVDLDIQSSRKSLEATQFDEKTNRSHYFPELNFSVDAYQEDLNSTGTPFTGIKTQTIKETLELSQNLFSGMSHVYDSTIAKNKTDIAKFNFILKQAERIAQLKSIYIDAAYNKKLMELSSRIKTQRIENLKIVDLNYQNGREHKGTLMLIQAYLEEANFDLFQATQNHQIAINQLSQALHLDENEKIDVSLDFDLEDPKGKPEPRKLALQLPEYKVAILNEDVSLHQFKQSRSKFSPTLDAYGKIYKSGDTFEQMDNHWTVGLTFTVPLFAGGKDYYSYKSSELTSEASKINTRSVALNLESKIESTWGYWVEKAEKCKFNLAFVKAAQVRSTIARKKYANGLISFDDWDSIENKLVDREKDYLKSLKEKWSAESDWLQLITQSEYEGMNYDKK